MSKPIRLPERLPEISANLALPKKLPDDTAKKLIELGKILKSAPEGSRKYKQAMKELDAILGIPQEPLPEGESDNE